MREDKGVHRISDPAAPWQAEVFPLRDRVRWKDQNCNLTWSGDVCQKVVPL